MSGAAKSANVSAKNAVISGPVGILLCISHVWLWSFSPKYFLNSPLPPFNFKNNLQFAKVGGDISVQW